MPTAEKILALARAELGVKESPAGSNNVKYNTAYYGREVSGPNFAWCLVFIWWLFRQAGAGELFYGGGKTAYVPAFLAWAKKEGLLVDKPKSGDLVCFDFNNNVTPDHIGICESWDGTYVTTIDGNTGTGNEANGGAVMRRRRHKKYITAVIRPKYEEEEDMTEAEVRKIIQKVEDEKKAKEPSKSWGVAARKWALETGMISGDEKGNPQWEAYVTRNQLVTILYKFGDWLLGRLGVKVDF